MVAGKETRDRHLDTGRLLLRKTRESCGRKKIRGVNHGVCARLEHSLRLLQVREDGMQVAVAAHEYTCMQASVGAWCRRHAEERRAEFEGRDK